MLEGILILKFLTIDIGRRVQPQRYRLWLDILTQAKFRMVQVRIDNVKDITTDVRRKTVDQ